MLVFKDKYIGCFLGLVLTSFICFSNARQIPYSRYSTEMIDSQSSTNTLKQRYEDNENEFEAIVREIILAPYPANGFKPSMIFPLQGETVAQSKQDDAFTSTTKTIDFTTTTQGYENEAPTATNSNKKDTLNINDSERVGKVEDVLVEPKEHKTPYPPAGLQPKIPFLLPRDNFFKSKQQQVPENTTDGPNEVSTELPSESEIKAPYPATGYRPAKLFFLPSEQPQLEDDRSRDFNTKNDNSKHPVCGSSTNPLAPKPLDGEKTNPDSESININKETRIGS